MPPATTELAAGIVATDSFIGLRSGHELRFAHVELGPGQATVWHYHPGPVLVAVRAGLLRVECRDGAARTFTAGQSFVEAPGRENIHRGMSLGTRSVELVVAYLVPPGLQHQIEC